MASFPRFLAVDLGASAVRLVEIGPDARGRPVLLSLIEEAIAFDPAKTGELFPAVTQALSAAVGRLPGKTRVCYLCLGGPAVFARILKVPAADAAKVQSMIGFEAQQTVPAVEQALWDYQLLASPQPGELEALILAIKKDTVDEMTVAAASAGLKPQGVTLAPAALLNGFFFHYPEVTGCHLILDIGARATTILLVEGERLFVRVVPLGGSAISQAVATDLQESFAGAETLKRAKGFVHPGGAYEEPADPTAARISKLARGVMTRLYTEVERSLTFFRSQQGGGKPTQAWLTGGGATLAHSDIFFREKLRIPVNWFQPFRRLSLPANGEAQAAAAHFSSWSVAVGTALQSLPEAPLRINVLGSAGRIQAQKTRERPARIVVAAAAASLMLLPGLHGFWQAWKSGRGLAEEQARVQEASQVLQNLEEQNKKLQAVLGQLESALQIDQERQRWPRLLEELRRHTPKGLWITGLRVLPTDPPEAARTDRSQPTGSEIPILEIAGMFETRSEKSDAEAVAKFQKALEEGGLLRKVAVRERETPQYVEGRTDQVALKFLLQAEWPMPSAEKKSKPGGGT